MWRKSRWTRTEDGKPELSARRGVEAAELRHIRCETALLEGDVEVHREDPGDLHADGRAAVDLFVESVSRRVSPSSEFVCLNRVAGSPNQSPQKGLCRLAGLGHRISVD